MEGLLRSPVSWARVLRELGLALASHPQVDLAMAARRGFRWARDFPLPPVLTNLPRKHRNPHVRLVFAYPPQLSRYESDTPLWTLSVYEASRLPRSWSRPLQKIPDRVLVPSRHVYRIYRRSGLHREKLSVVPYGYDSNPSDRLKRAERGEPVRLLTLATPHFRKGLDKLMMATDLVRGDHLAWRVHSPYRPEAGDIRFWEDPRILHELEQAGLQVSVGSLSDEDIAHLQSQADLVVQPSRSEGFGLAMLEAMAAGTATLTSNWGGHLDFAGPGMVLVEGHLRPAHRCQYDVQTPGARVFEPDARELRSNLISLLEDRRHLRELGRKAEQTVSGWTWTRAAQQIVNLFREHLPTPD